MNFPVANKVSIPIKSFPTEFTFIWLVTYKDRKKKNMFELKNDFDVCSILTQIFFVRVYNLDSDFILL